jgi:hypothetical protein
VVTLHTCVSAQVSIGAGSRTGWERAPPGRGDVQAILDHLTDRDGKVYFYRGTEDTAKTAAMLS